MGGGGGWRHSRIESLQVLSTLDFGLWTWTWIVTIILYQIFFVACSHRKIYNITITIGEGRLSVCNIQ